MGGYGGLSGRVKDNCYRDTEGINKIKDKNAITVAEYYMSLGMYVAFYHEDGNYRPDLSVDLEMVVEVKGISSKNSTRIKENIEHANKQIEAELSKYPEDKRHPGKIVLLSLHSSFEIGYRAAYEGFQKAKREGVVNLDYAVEFWFNGEIHILN